MYVHKPQVNGGSQGLLTALFMLGVVRYYYRRQTKFAKVMFLQVSVCPRGGMHGCGGVCGCSGEGHTWLLLGGHVWLLPGGHAWQRGGMHGRGGWGVCMVKGGMHGKGGSCVAKGGSGVTKGGMHGKGGRAWYARPVIARAVRILLECILV